MWHMCMSQYSSSISNSSLNFQYFNDKVDHDLNKLEAFKHACNIVFKMYYQLGANTNVYTKLLLL